MCFASGLAAVGAWAGTTLDAVPSHGTLGAPNPGIVEAARQVPDRCGKT
jgi:hypothetical protein